MPVSSAVGMVEAAKVLSQLTWKPPRSGSPASNPSDDIDVVTAPKDARGNRKRNESQVRWRGWCREYYSDDDATAVSGLMHVY